MTPAKPVDPNQKGTPNPHRLATPSDSSSCSDHDMTEDEEYVSCFLEWLRFDLDSKRVLDDEMMMFAHHERKMGSKAILFIQQAVNEDPELVIEARPQITMPMYAMCRVIVRFATRLRNIS